MYFIVLVLFEPSVIHITITQPPLPSFRLAVPATLRDFSKSRGGHNNCIAESVKSVRFEITVGRNARDCALRFAPLGRIPTTRAGQGDKATGGVVALGMSI